MKLYYCNSDKSIKEYIGEFTTVKAANAAWHKKLTDCGVNWGYVRMWREEDGDVWYDFGSWSRFFVIEEVDREAWDEEINNMCKK